MRQITVAPPKNFQSPVVREWTTKDASWFAVYTSARHEKFVAKHLSEREIESFLPLYQKEHHWRKRSAIRLELPLFPNYVFVHIGPYERIPVLALPGVLGIVGGRIPAPLPDAEIDALRLGLAMGRPEPHPGLVEGKRVRITAGAMAGMEGVLLRRKNEMRVVLTIDLIQRSVAVEVNVDDVEPVFRQ